MEWQLYKQKKLPSQKKKVISTKIKIITIILLLAELIFFILFTKNYDPPRREVIFDNGPTTTINDIFSLPTEFELPRKSETLTASQQEPLSFIIAAPNDADFISTMQKGGWFLADSINRGSLEKIIDAGLTNTPYPNAPMTPSFWDGQTHDFGFEKSTAKHSLKERHHARFWKTNLRTKNGKVIYVGTASFDTGIKWWGTTHRIAPDIDTEREILFNDLQTTNAINKFQKNSFVSPLLGKNFAGDQFFTDGNIYIIDLK
jgi:undecaprenyl-diphosphatase